MNSNRTGTCQACFNSQKVSKGAGTLISLHGYRRPGHGYITGRCLGENAQPFEVSCEVTKEMRALVASLLGEKTDRLAELNSGTVTEIVTSFGKNHPAFKILKSINDANPYTSQGPQGWCGTTFVNALDAEIRRVKNLIGKMEGDLKFLDEKIAGWVKVWES